jgi:hypothetical protein
LRPSTTCRPINLRVRNQPAWVTAGNSLSLGHRRSWRYISALIRNHSSTMPQSAHQPKSFGGSQHSVRLFIVESLGSPRYWLIIDQCDSNCLASIYFGFPIHLKHPSNLYLDNLIPDTADHISDIIKSGNEPGITAQVQEIMRMGPQKKWRKSHRIFRTLGGWGQRSGVVLLSRLDG